MFTARTRFTLVVMLLPLSVTSLGCSDGDGGEEEAKTYSIGGTIAGLTGGGLVLTTAGQPDLTVSAGAISFTFAEQVPSGTTYAVEVVEQPAAQTCVIESGAGTVAGANVAAVAVTCTDAAWTATEPMTWARSLHGLTALPSGRVLATGADIYGPAPATAACEVYDEASGAWSDTGSMSISRAFHAAIRLPSGKVLVAGGQHDVFLTSNAYLESAELFDEGTGGGTWSMTGSMSEPKARAVPVLLDSGEVLLVGGETTGGASVATVERYDPTTGDFALAASMARARRWHTATRLQTGEILVVGGCTNLGCTVTTAKAELFDPAQGTWRPAGSLPAGLAFHVATLLKNGKVLVTGGTRQEPGYVAISGAYLYDPATNAWTTASSMRCPRWLHVAKVLTSGKVLVAGGTLTSSAGCAMRTEIYEPAKDTLPGTPPAENPWTWGPDLHENHGSALEAAPLPSGAWLVAGGIVDVITQWSSVPYAEVHAE